MIKLSCNILIANKISDWHSHQKMNFNTIENKIFQIKTKKLKIETD